MGERVMAARFRVDHGSFQLDVDIELPGRGVSALFGPSGSGKTTLLRCIAGLTRCPRGRLTVNGEVWQDEAERLFVPTHRRSLGMVFQDARLFPHLSVRRNLEFGMKRAPSVAARDFETVVDLLDLGPLLARMPSHLSGGERQRVAIGRALLVRPRLLLMDEPLASLDARRRLEILPYLERLRDELAMPILYVSHSLDEVARLADHLVVLEAGQVKACGAPAATLARLDLPMADDDDAGAVVEGVVSARDEHYQLSRVDFDGGSLWLGSVDHPRGARVRVRVRARDVSIALSPPMATSVLNVVPATLVDIGDSGPHQVNLQLALGGSGSLLLARITRRSRDELRLAPGMRVYAQIKGVALT